MVTEYLLIDTISMVREAGAMAALMIQKVNGQISLDEDAE